MKEPIRRQGTNGALVALLVVAVAGALVAAGYFMSLLFNDKTTSSSSFSSEQSNQLSSPYIFTNNPSPYFPSGHYSNNSTVPDNGNPMQVGPVSFTREYPSNLLTETTVVGGKATTVVQTVEYRCGISMGARQIYNVRFSNGTNFRLDYCEMYNYVIDTVYRSNPTASWSLWEVSRGTTPVVALHMTGEGQDVSSVELWVGK